MSETLHHVPTPRRRWVEAAKGVWYAFLRRMRLVAPVFSGARPGSTVQRGSAHAWGRRHHHPAGHAGVAADDPILRTLRQRAVRELFEWLGLAEIPKGYWTLLERLGDPSRTLITFIANSGFDPMLVRKRDATELAAFQTFVRFVCQIEGSADLLSEGQRVLLDRHMYYGEHAIVRSLLELFVTLGEALALFERSPEPYRFAASARHARRVATLRESATLADLPEAKALLEISAQHARLTRRFRNAVDRKERLEAAAEQWVTPFRHDQAVWTLLLFDLAKIQGALMAEAHCDVLKTVEEFERGIDRLTVLLDEVARWVRDAADVRKRREEQAGHQWEQWQRDNEGRARPDREAHGLAEDELLATFGFPPGASPDLRMLRRAFIKEANKTLPIFGQPDYRERNERYRKLKDAYERLKVAFG